MADYWRCYVPGGSYFSTVVTERWAAIRLANWSMPPGDCDYSKRWGIIKKHFTQDWLALGGVEQTVSEAKRHNHRRGVWQQRFWEHTLRDELDYHNHFDYLHLNSVKHGLVDKISNWPYSLFLCWVKQDVYFSY